MIPVKWIKRKTRQPRGLGTPLRAIRQEGHLMSTGLLLA